MQHAVTIALAATILAPWIGIIVAGIELHRHETRLRTLETQRALAADAHSNDHTAALMNSIHQDQADDAP